MINPRPVVKVENLRRRTPTFSVGAQPRDADVCVNIRCQPYLPFFLSTCTCVLSTIRWSKHIQCHRRPSLQFRRVSLHASTDVVIWAYTTVPWRLVYRSCAFYELAGARTLLANDQRYRNAVLCVPRHFNH